MSIVAVQSFILSLLNGLPMPYGVSNAQAYITPPDPRVKAKVPAIYIWPAEGRENRSAELGGTIPRNSGVNTPSGTKGVLHDMDVYVTWFSGRFGKTAGPYFPGDCGCNNVRAAVLPAEPGPVPGPEHAGNQHDLQRGRDHDVPDWY